MPKRKTVDAEVVPAAKPKASASTHKRATKKAAVEESVVSTLEAAVVPAAEPAVVPAVEPAVVPAPASSRPVSEEDIALLAYSYWEARGCQGGNPEEDWFRAQTELAELAQNR